MKQVRLAAFVVIASTSGCSGAGDDQIIITPDAGDAITDASAVATDAGSIDAGTPDAGTADAGMATPTWSGNVQPLFTQRCSPCHDPGNQRRRVVVTNYAAIAGPISPASGMAYITPFEPEQSWIQRKLERTQVQVCRDNMRPTRDCGGVMPTSMGTALTPAQIQLVRDWISAGATQD